MSRLLVNVAKLITHIAVSQIGTEGSELIDVSTELIIVQILIRTTTFVRWG